MIGYFGSITKKSFSPTAVETARDCWSGESNERDYRIEGANTCTATLEQNRIKLFLLGIVRRNGQSFHKDQSVILAEILSDYEKSGALRIEGLEGSFTVVLVDPEKERLFLYRNIVGSTFAFYTQTESGLFFGNNLAEVARKSQKALRVAEEQLPIYFYYRLVPDSYTLFKDIYRIHPGEMLQWHRGKVSVQRIQTVADYLEAKTTNEKDSIDRFESVMHEVLSDWNQLVPNTAVLLSGGVDSTLIQVHWNRIWHEFHAKNEKPKSVAVVLDHPHTKPDFDYTMTAVEECGTEHINIMQPLLTVDLMKDVFAQTGEMPNHVQSFFFWTLAKGMKREGLHAGISGEGADGLFGSGGPSLLLQARGLKNQFPLRMIRSWIASLGNLLKPDNYRSKLFTLSCHLDDLNWEGHPFNQAAAFCHSETVHRTFTDESVSNVFTFRRKKIQEYGVPRDSDYLQWTNLAGYFFEGINTAAYWGQMFLSNGVQMYSPFQDSRIVRVASNIDLSARFVINNPKQILKKALLRHVSLEFANRPKLSFGQPIFEWLSPGGCLRDAAENIADYSFMPKKVKQDILDKPNWILWSLLCFDLWHKEFIG